MNNWQYYNNALIPATPPHIVVNDSQLKDKKFWKSLKSKVYFARYITDYDCGYETNWWYVIKDAPLEIENLKKKRRYEIKKGLKNFEIKKIDPIQYKDDIFYVYIQAQQSYSKKNQFKINKNDFLKNIEKWDKYVVYGAFYSGDNRLCGYSILKECGKCISLSVQKTIPDFEKYALNAALIAKILEDYKHFITNGCYICDGARNINHETNFQDYLEKYFEFRKAYCKLKIVYNPKYKFFIKMLYPFRKILRKLDNIKMIHKINGVMTMEEYVRLDNE